MRRAERKADAGAVRAKAPAPDEEEEEEPAYAAAHLVASSTVHMGDMCACIGVQCARQALRGGFRSSRCAGRMAIKGVQRVRAPACRTL